jgi:glutamate 5-kinase
MHLYARAFEKLAPPRAVGQLLLTRDGLEDRQRYLNARHTIEALFACGAVPIVNENDTVSVDEIRFGDNDNLSALVAAAAEAELLVILTDVEGLLEAPPAVNPNAKRIALVAALTPEIEALAKPPESSVGTGGMVTKLQAAKIVTGAGEGMVLCCGRNPEILLEVAAGCDVGTYFMPSGDKLSARKRWLAYTQRAQGTLQVDAGAQAALCQRHKSLLPGGILEVQGNFDSGALVELRGPEGAPFARGLCNYGSAEVERIKGKNTAQAAKELGPLLFDEVVHRDNLVIL